MSIKPQGISPLGGGQAPSIRQLALNVGAAISGATFASAPSQGNLLIAISSTSGAVSPGSGWQIFSGSQPGGVFGGNQAGILWKIAGAAESTTQQPWNANNGGAIAIYEIVGGAPSIWNIAINQTSASQALAVVAAKTNGLICGMAWNRTDTTLATSFTGATADASATGGGFSVQGLHVSNPPKGSNSVTVNWAASKNFDFYLITFF